MPRGFDDIKISRGHAAYVVFEVARRKLGRGWEEQRRQEKRRKKENKQEKQKQVVLGRFPLEKCDIPRGLRLPKSVLPVLFFNIFPYIQK